MKHFAFILKNDLVNTSFIRHISSQICKMDAKVIAIKICSCFEACHWSELKSTT